MVKRWMIEVGFLAALAGFFLYILLEAREMRFQGALFPYVVVGVAAVLIAVRLWQVLRHVFAGEEEEYGVAAELQAEFWSRLSLHRALEFAVWLLAIVGLTWLAGLVLGLTAGTMLFLRYAAKTSWRLALVLGAAAFTYLAGLLNWGLGMRITSGRLFEWVARLTG